MARIPSLGRLPGVHPSHEIPKGREQTMSYLNKMAVRFSSKSDEERFTRLVPQLIQTVKTVPGFIMVNFWRSLEDPDLFMEDSYWESREAALKWRQHPMHAAAMKAGLGGLLLEATTSRWLPDGKTDCYYRCPLCQHLMRSERETAELARATARPDVCGSCGFKFPLPEK